MRYSTARFQTDILASHRALVEAVILDTTGAETPIGVLDGTVTLDQNAAIRGRCDLTVVDDGSLGLIPADTGSLLAPYGNEIRISRGILYPDGTSELISLGVFRIEESDVNASSDAVQIRISGLDRAARIIDARFEDPYQVSAGVNYVTALESVLTDAWPDIVTDFPTTTLVTPALVAQEGDDRWQFAQDMATSLGMELYFDGDGVCVLRPSVASAAVASVVEGEGGALLEAGRSWTREGSFNAVIATGENTGLTTPARGVARDENPLSPTYYYGPFGKVPRFYSSSFLTTDAQAVDAAAALLSKELGTTQQVSFGALVLPQLEPSDTVRITREQTSIDEDHIIDSLTLPLAATGSMSGQTRTLTVG